MRTMLTALTTFAFAATAALADTNTYQSIIGDAARIQQDAQAISAQLKGKSPDFATVKTRSADLNKDIQELRSDLDKFEATQPNLTADQKKEWELVKTKAQLLLVFSDAKSDLLNFGDPQQNKNLLKAYADGIVKRAAMLQETAKQLAR